mmetsp:Transcript_39589/g.54978  ORF Transcript_39589/g.54978 Transcript_39589/m.54978 type:complete len:227 (+) Transcript_39589:117-797(+)|eukprot:CAMPEP_0196585492 /NCGR_PEP_ID=MMETSP1081-20130531/50910_1 /TAXON_ID=36882 /ORGANISM="Pyramimonas amylifera, Strain CCMP720" /LENGTH=226 /DNA_ID=CAMNT_0041907059 /DNA_START=154 /DNA_END=837 /DNA_ORIENTATION=+
MNSYICAPITSCRVIKQNHQSVRHISRIVPYCKFIGNVPKSTCISIVTSSSVSRKIKANSSSSTPPPRWKSEGDDTVVDADDDLPDQVVLCANIKDLVNRLNQIGVKKGKLNLYVAGSYSDLKAVTLLQQVTADQISGPLPTDDLFKLQYIVEVLEDVYEEKGEEYDRGADKMESILTDRLNISEDEKKEMGAAMGGAMKGAIDVFFWSTIGLVLLALSLYNFIRP